MTNQLQHENSPYLIQHANNPVDWYPWGEIALQRAVREDKPIFLSIGYAACHWCHVMENESFEDKGTAIIMNENFINIKVDREERPDLDNIYMNAVVAMTGQGGWPMSVFLTPDGKPFYGGTYFPPVRRYNMPSFQEILNTIARLWKEDRERLLQSSDQITEHLKKNQSIDFASQELKLETLDAAVLNLSQAYDWKHGGWGKAPKFPQPMAIRFLLQRAARGDKLALDVACDALTAMAKGGMYDVIGGGFARYSTDDYWLVPHFEKMLYDSAQLARVYLYAYLITGNHQYRQVCENTLDFMIREMSAGWDPARLSEQGLFSSLDADSEGEEGKYYLWTFDEMMHVLGFDHDIDKNVHVSDNKRLFLDAYGVSREGNFEGMTVLQRQMDDDVLSERFMMDKTQVNERLEQMHHKLLLAREKRIRPATDDKILVSWNAMALVSFAEAARYLNNSKYLEVSRSIASFILNELIVSDCLMRSWRDGNARHNAYLEDYATLILGLLALYQSDPNNKWFDAGIKLAIDMTEHFRDPKHGFFDTRDDHEGLLLRPKDIQDNATPSGNASAATALLQLATLTGNLEWREIAVEMLESIQKSATRYPTAFAEWLCAMDFAQSAVKEVAIIGELEDVQTQALIQQLWVSYRPNLIAAISPLPPDENAPELLKNRDLINNKPTAYVCEHFVCLRPVNSPSELAMLLNDEN